MDDFNIIIDGETAVEAALDRLTAEVADTRAPLTAAGRILGHNQAERMRAGIMPDITDESRQQRKGDKSAPPLIDTGQLIKAVLAGSAVSFPTFHAVWELTPDGLTKGVGGDPVERLQYGFQGEDALGRHIDQAARPFVTATPGDEAEIKTAYERYLDAQIYKDFA